MRKYLDNSFLLLHENISCGYSREVPRQGASNEYPHHLFSCIYKKHISAFGRKKKCLTWSYGLYTCTDKLTSNMMLQDIFRQCILQPLNYHPVSHAPTSESVRKREFDLYCRQHQKKWHLSIIKFIISQATVVICDDFCYKAHTVYQELITQSFQLSHMRVESGLTCNAQHNLVSLICKIKGSPE